MRNTSIEIDVEGAKQVADFILIQRFELLSDSRISKREFERMRNRAQKLRAQLDQLGGSIRSFPREVKTRLRRCLEALAKLVSGQLRPDRPYVQEFLHTLCATPA